MATARPVNYADKAEEMVAGDAEGIALRLHERLGFKNPKTKHGREQFLSWSQNSAVIGRGAD